MNRNKFWKSGTPKIEPAFIEKFKDKITYFPLSFDSFMLLTPFQKSKIEHLAKKTELNKIEQKYILKVLENKLPHRDFSSFRKIAIKDIYVTDNRGGQSAKVPKYLFSNKILYYNREYDIIMKNVETDEQLIERNYKFKKYRGNPVLLWLDEENYVKLENLNKKLYVIVIIL